MAISFLFASDSFKGSLSSQRAGELLQKAAQEVFPFCVCRSIQMADGGEGTTDAVLASVQGEKIHLTVHDPLYREHHCYYGKLNQSQAIMEMASASGLPLVESEKRNPLFTTSFGTGEMIRHALDQGFTDIRIAIGGSATNDGGMGAMTALGVRFLDADGNALLGFGKDLAQVRSIDTTQLDPRITSTTFTVMCDVNNVLCGEHGATYTFGRQKGATDETLPILEAGMQNLRDVIKAQFGIDCDQIPGAGAAGGLGAALLVFLKAQLQSGVECVLDLVHFDEALQGVDYVITGEGATDWQSCFGKVLQGVGMHSKAHSVPAFAIVGSMGKGAEDIMDYGIESIITTVNAPMDLSHAMLHTEGLYKSAAKRLFRLIKAVRRE